MPAAIPFIVGAVAKVVFASQLIAGIVTVASSMLVGAYQKRKAEKKAREQFNASQVDRMANVMTTVAPRDLVLGRVRKGGPVVFRGSAGAYKEILIQHIALAAHEIDGIERIYLNDQPVTLDADGWVQDEPYLLSRKVSTTTSVAGCTAGQTLTLPFTPIAGTTYAYQGSGTVSDEIVAVSITVAGNVITFNETVSRGVVIGYQYNEGTPYARIRWDLGGGTAVADARTMELFPSLWTSAHRGQGIAKLICEFRYNDTAFAAGLPQVSALIRGAKVYDPRDGLTKHTENPALLARHVYQHPQFGKATVTASEDARFIAAANACQVNQDYVVDGVVDTEPLYVAGMVVQYGTQAQAVLDDLVQAMAGMWAFAGGELYIRAGVWTSPVMTLTDADLATVQRDEDSENQDPITIAVHRERAEKFNVVNARIWDQAQGYKHVALTPLKASALITRDGQELAQEIEIPAVPFAPQALHICGVMMRDARDSLTMEAAWKMRAYPLELFDVVNVTLSRYGWTNKTFMVLSRVWDPSRGVVRTTMKETAAAIYTPDASFLPQGYADNTSLPKPWDIQPPIITSGDIYSGSSELVLQADGTVLTRVRVTWPPLGDDRITKVEVQWASVSDMKWQAEVVDDASQNQVSLSGPADGDAIVIRARSKSSLATSDWSSQVTHIVVGKTEPPPAVDTFDVVEQPNGVKQFFWTITNPPPDLFSFVCRYALGTVEQPWENMLDLFAKGTNARQHETSEPQSGNDYTFAICTVDRSGNRSTPVYKTVTLDGTALGTILANFFAHELGWPGTKTNCYVSNQVLVDYGTLTWTGFGTTTWLDATMAWGDTYSSPIGYEHPVFDIGADTTCKVRAQSLTSGTATTEFCYSSDNVTFTAWSAIPNAPVTARYFKFRWSVAGAPPVLHRAQATFYT